VLDYDGQCTFAFSPASFPFFAYMDGWPGLYEYKSALFNCELAIPQNVHMK
jgi:hypothetical protein